MALTDIADRLTPSVPIELSFAATPIAAGTKFTTLFAHRAQSGGVSTDYDMHTVVNVADPDAAKAEVDNLAGAGSQAGQMAYAFVAANSKVGRLNFPAFRVVLLPYNEPGFGPNGEGLSIVRTERSDMLVSCYPASNSSAQQLLDLAAQMGGPDRDLNGQFGTTVTFATLAAPNDAIQIKPNSRNAIIHWLPDTSQQDIVITGTVNQNATQIFGVSSFTGLALGQTVESANLTGGSGKIVSLDPLAHTITLDSPFIEATQPNTPNGDSFTVKAQPAQAVEIVAAACAGAMMSLGQPYRPAQGMPIGGLVAPVKRSDWIMIDPNGLSEAALAAGLSPLTVQPGAVVGFVRTRLTLTLKPDGVTAVTDYVDWQQIQKLYDYREALYQASQNPPFNNNPGGAMASADIAAKFADEMLRIASEFEKAGMFQNVKLLSKYFVCVPSTTSRGRLDARVPVDAVPGLYVLAANIVAVSDAVNFTV